MGESREEVWGLIAKYEVLFNRWTRSGFHGDFDAMMDEAIAHSKDNTNPAMLYLHEYLSGVKNHKFFNICIGFLPNDTFCESASGTPHCQSQDTPAAILLLGGIVAVQVGVVGWLMVVVDALPEEGMPRKEALRRMPYLYR